jgi:hypothetical protein
VPQCRSYAYTAVGKTFYYYNWPYVDANKATMCPDPWRVPDESDFQQLVSATNDATLGAIWGYGGYATDLPTLDVGLYGTFWSATADSSSHAYTVYYGSGYLGMNSYVKRIGFEVVCVK